MRNFAVIGLGRFGASVARTLAALGHEVLGVDISEKKVQDLSETLTHVVIADAKDEDALRALGISNFDGVVVAIGQDLEANILVTVMLSDMGIRNITAKAQTELHGQVLKKVGASKVVYPEKDMGVKVAKSISSETVLDFIELSPSHSIVEFIAPDKLVGKTLGSLNLRARYGISVLAIKKGEKVIIAPGAEDLVEAGDLLVVVGENDAVSRCSD